MKALIIVKLCSRSMAPNTLEQNTKTGYSLSLVPFLDGPDDWEDYRSGVQTYLVLNQQLEWLEDHEIKPNGAAAEKEWKRKHRLAITAMRDRVNYNAKDLTEGFESYMENRHSAMGCFPPTF